MNTMTHSSKIVTFKTLARDNVRYSPNSPKLQDLLPQRLCLVANIKPNSGSSHSPLIAHPPFTQLLAHSLMQLLYDSIIQ